MGKKFLGLGGTDHFWDRAKAWILNQITSAVAAKIAEVVANAPEDLDTLKEIADWISTHADDAAAMNTQINENKNNIAANASSISAMNTQIQANAEAIAGKADKVHTHSASDITSGTLAVANGGTGVTTQAEINRAFIGNLEVGNYDVTDGTEFVSSWASDKGFAETAEGALNKPYKRQFIKVWNYIKGKISSVLGLTKDNYSGKSAQTDFLTNYSSTRLTSGNIVPKDASEYGGMRKDVVTSSMTDSGHPGQDGHLLTMFWDNSGRFDSQLYISNNGNYPGVKVRYKSNGTDYGAWVDVITSNNIGRQAVSNASTADSLFYRHGNEINFKGGAQSSCWFNYRNADTGGPSPVDTMEYRFCNYSGDTSKSVLIAGSFNGATAKASSKMVIPIGAPSSLEDGCIWIER